MSAIMREIRKMALSYSFCRLGWLFNTPKASNTALGWHPCSMAGLGRGATTGIGPNRLDGALRLSRGAV